MEFFHTQHFSVGPTFSISAYLGHLSLSSFVSGKQSW